MSWLMLRLTTHELLSPVATTLSPLRVLEYSATNDRREKEAVTPSRSSLGGVAAWLKWLFRLSSEGKPDKSSLLSGFKQSLAQQNNSGRKRHKEHFVPLQPAVAVLNSASVAWRRSASGLVSPSSPYKPPVDPIEASFSGSNKATSENIVNAAACVYFVSGARSLGHLVPPWRTTIEKWQETRLPLREIQCARSNYTAARLGHAGTVWTRV